MIKKTRIINRAEMAYREIENIPQLCELSSTLYVRASHSISVHPREGGDPVKNITGNRISLGSRLRGNDWG